MANVMVFGIHVSQFEHLPYYYVDFRITTHRKYMNFLNNTAIVWVTSQMFFYKEDFGIN